MKRHEVRTFGAASAVLRRTDLRQALYDEAATLLGGAVINLHGEAHRARRGEEAKIFRKNFFQYYERNVLKPELEATLAPHVRAGEADLVDLGYRLMLNLTCDFAGVDRPLRSREETEVLLRLLKTFNLAAVLDQSTLDDIGGMKAKLAAGIESFDTLFLAPSIDRRLAIISAVREGQETEEALPRDVLTILLQARDKLGMSHKDLLQEIIFFLLAGSHTSVHALTHVMNELFDWVDEHPEDRARLTGDPLFVQRCVHESLRLHPSSPIAKRRSQCPMHVDSIGAIEEQEDVIIFLEDANRDGEAFGADADRFCPHRAVNGASPYGLSMGMGMHACLGLNLAVGSVPKPGTDPASHHLGTVSVIVAALLAANIRPHPVEPPVRDETTTRAAWSRFPVVFERRRAEA